MKTWRYLKSVLEKLENEITIKIKYISKFT